MLSIGGYVIKSNPEKDGKKWAEISIFEKCESIPWENSTIEHFFESEGILIYGIHTIERKTCEDCGCQSDKKIEILIDKDDYLNVAKVMSKYLFPK